MYLSWPPAPPDPEAPFHCSLAATICKRAAYLKMLLQELHLQLYGPACAIAALRGCMCCRRPARLTGLAAAAYALQCHHELHSLQGSKALRVHAKLQCLFSKRLDERRVLQGAPIGVEIARVRLWQLCTAEAYCMAVPCKVLIGRLEGVTCIGCTWIGPPGLFSSPHGLVDAVCNCTSPHCRVQEGAPCVKVLQIAIHSIDAPHFLQRFLRVFDGWVLHLVHGTALLHHLRCIPLQLCNHLLPCCTADHCIRLQGVAFLHAPPRSLPLAILFNHAPARPPQHSSTDLQLVLIVQGCKVTLRLPAGLHVPLHAALNGCTLVLHIPGPLGAH